MPFVFRIMAFNYCICIVLIWQTLSGETQSPRRDNFSVCHKRKSPLSLTFFSSYIFGLLLVLLVFILLARFYHTALLARLFMRKVAQSTCKIKIIISSCWATAIICAPCAVHITQPEYSEGGMGREREGELEKKCKCSETLCVSFMSVCQCVVALLSMLHVVQLS